MSTLIKSEDYYSEYFGHDPRHLKRVHEELRRGGRACIFLAGDSSLDNKFWFESRAPAENGYERVLSPPQMKKDVCYWLNSEASKRGLDHVFCLNTAVEATSLNSRACCQLLPQDQFIHDHITSQDYLVVSIGGNDLALTPVLATIVNIIPLLCLTPQACIERMACACPPNTHIDCGCVGCGAPGCLVSAFGWPPGLAYFVDLFGHRVQNYVERVLDGARPAKVVVCMIYYLDVHGRGSWADGFLCAMGYNCAPSRLQAAIKTVFRLATSRIRIPGVEVLAYPLFTVLDGSDPYDYVQRVEPSVQGGGKSAYPYGPCCSHAVARSPVVHACTPAFTLAGMRFRVHSGLRTSRRYVRISRWTGR